jgi:hypothetical protein
MLRYNKNFIYRYRYRYDTKPTFVRNEALSLIRLRTVLTDDILVFCIADLSVKRPAIFGLKSQACNSDAENGEVLRTLVHFHPGVTPFYKKLTQKIYKKRNRFC